MQPQLDDLSRRYGVTAIGVELPNLQHMIVVALSRSQAPVRLHVDVGSRFPALISATGRCVAAFGSHPPAEIEKRFRALRWNNAPSYEAWRKEVETVRRQGYSIDRGNYIAGVTIVAVPVLNAQARSRTRSPRSASAASSTATDVGRAGARHAGGARRAVGQPNGDRRADRPAARAGARDRRAARGPSRWSMPNSTVPTCSG